MNKQQPKQIYKIQQAIQKLKDQYDASSILGVIKFSTSQMENIIKILQSLMENFKLISEYKLLKLSNNEIDKQSYCIGEIYQFYGKVYEEVRYYYNRFYFDKQIKVIKFWDMAKDVIKKAIQNDKYYMHIQVDSNKVDKLKQKIKFLQSQLFSIKSNKNYNCLNNKNQQQNIVKLDQQFLQKQLLQQNANSSNKQWQQIQKLLNLLIKGKVTQFYTQINTSQLGKNNKNKTNTDKILQIVAKQYQYFQILQTNMLSNFNIKPHSQQDKSKTLSQRCVEYIKQIKINIIQQIKNYKILNLVSKYQKRLLQKLEQMQKINQLRKLLQKVILRKIKHLSLQNKQLTAKKELNKQQNGQQNKKQQPKLIQIQETNNNKLSEQGIKNQNKIQIQNQINIKNKQLQQLNENLLKLNNNKEQYEIDIKNKKQIIQKINFQIKQLQLKYKKEEQLHIIKINKLQQQQNILLSKINQMKQFQNPIHQNYQQLQKKITQLNKKQKQLRKSIQNIDMQYLSKQKQVSQLQNQINYMNSMVQKNNKIKFQYNAIEQKCKQKQKQFKSIQLKISQSMKNKQFQKLKQQKELSQLKQEKNKLEQQSNIKLQQLEKQISKKQNKLKQLTQQVQQSKKLSTTNNPKLIFHKLFVGQVIKNDDDKQFIINCVQNLYKNRKIIKTKLIYSFRLLKALNPHIFIDKIPNYILILTLKNKDKNNNPYILSMYSQKQLKQHDTINNGIGFVSSVTNRKIYNLVKTDKTARVTQYSDYYIVYGKGQIQFKIGSNIIDFNIGHNYKSIDTGKYKDSVIFTGQPDDKAEILDYQFYQIIFDDQVQNIIV